MRHSRERRSRLRWVGAICVLLTSALIAVWFVGEEEPEYEGRTLSSWLTEFDHTPWDTNTQAAIAIRGMGTNIIPFLVEDIMERDPKWREKLRRQQRSSRIAWVRQSPAGRARLRASHALRVLGPDAAPALPLLIQELHEPRGQSGLPWVGITAIAQGDPETIPTIIHELGDPAYRYRMARMLISAPGSPEVTVPYLVDCLRDKDWETRYFGLLALQKLGPAAGEAEAAVRSLLTDDHPRVAAQARSTLEQITRDSSGDPVQ